MARSKNQLEFSRYKKQKIKRELLAEYTIVCYYCKCVLSEDTLTLDHLLPIKLFPELRNANNNIVPSCYTCNHLKGSRVLFPKSYIYYREGKAALQNKQGRWLSSWAEAEYTCWFESIREDIYRLNEYDHKPIDWE